MLVYNCQIKTPTSELNSNYMIHVHTEIVVAEGLQECGNHSSINNTRIVLDRTGSDWIRSWIRLQIGRGVRSRVGSCVASQVASWVRSRIAKKSLKNKNSKWFLNSNNK